MSMLIVKSGEIFGRVFLQILCIVSSITVIHGMYTKTYWQASVPVYEYQAYSSIRLFEFTIPWMTWNSSWVFQVDKSDTRCKDRTVTVYIQYGSYPVMTPLNETYPSNFNLHRTDLQMISVESDTAVPFSISQPLPGNWYAAAFIGDYVDDRIQQKGLGLQCQYLLATTQMMDITDDVKEVVTSVDIPINVPSGKDYYFRFHSKIETWRYMVEISNCTYTEHTFVNSTEEVVTVDTCPFSVYARSTALPQKSEETDHVVVCENMTDCSLDVANPTADQWQYLLVSLPANEPNRSGSVQFNLKIETQECSPVEVKKGPDGEGEDEPAIINSTTVEIFNGTNATLAINLEMVTETVDDVAFPSGARKGPSYMPEAEDDIMVVPSVNGCIQVPQLGRFVQGRAFKTQYQLRYGSYPFPNRIAIAEDANPTLLRFDVKPIQDTGGTLHFKMDLEQDAFNIRSGQIVVAHACIQKWVIPINESGLSCDEENSFDVKSTDNGTSVVYFPYPEPGHWFIAFTAECYVNSTDRSDKVQCVDNVEIVFNVAVSPCVEGSCGTNGECREYYSGVFHFSSCRCTANWRGYGCTDDTVADSDLIQLVEALLLTLSNLLFFPAIILALYRRFFVEALVYTFTMFFSTFYHACDGNRKTVYCMMPYTVLAQGDFYGAIMSFWVTLVAMARQTERRRAFLFMVAALGLEMGVAWDRHSLWVFLVPAAVGLIIMLIAWAFQCHRRRTCYPTLKRYCFILLPGVLFAFLGLIIFAFLETDSNYKYTHSGWHGCMALSIVFLLPTRRRGNKPDLLHVSANTMNLGLVESEFAPAGHDIAGGVGAGANSNPLMHEASSTSHPQQRANPAKLMVDPSAFTNNIV